ncbi:hypothetical protein, partial [Pseudomonas aeruginosa]
HDRIVGELRAENERLANDRDRANQFANGAALEINAALARVEQQERTIAGMNEAHAKLAGLYEAAQAQHSVPEVSGIGRDFAYPRSVVLYLRTEPTDDDLRAIHDGLRSLAAAPGKEGV